VHLVGLYYAKYITIHGPENVEKNQLHI